VILTDGVHLLGADIEALHAFARRMGLKRCWFERDHYDLTTPEKAEKAVRAGALLVSMMDIGRWRRALRRGVEHQPTYLEPDDIERRAERARIENTRLLRILAGNRRVGGHGGAS
jgi:hypothetical protein